MRCEAVRMNFQLINYRHSLSDQKKTQTNDIIMTSSSSFSFRSEVLKTQTFALDSENTSEFRMSSAEHPDPEPQDKTAAKKPDTSEEWLTRARVSSMSRGGQRQKTTAPVFAMLRAKKMAAVERNDEDVEKKDVVKERTSELEGVRARALSTSVLQRRRSQKRPSWRESIGRHSLSPPPAEEVPVFNDLGLANSNCSL